MKSYQLMQLTAFLAPVLMQNLSKQSPKSPGFCCVWNSSDIYFISVSVQIVHCFFGYCYFVVDGAFTVAFFGGRGRRCVICIVLRWKVCIVIKNFHSSQNVCIVMKTLKLFSNVPHCHDKILIVLKSPSSWKANYCPQKSLIVFRSPAFFSKFLTRWSNVLYSPQKSCIDMTNLPVNF